MNVTVKVALVTGAGRGIGRAVALRLARLGYSIAVHYGRSAKEAIDVVREIEQIGGKAKAIQGDMGRVADIEALFAEVDAHFGRLDVLVNNAGVVQPSPIESLTEELFDKVFSVNVKGSTFAAKEAVKRLNAGGRIVNISSSRVHFPASGTTVYSGSKAAIELLTAIWARELGEKGITVNAVAPGPTVPGMFERAPESMKSEARHCSPFSRIGTADEIADVVAFLCSYEARWITGQTILVNGGGTM